MEEQPKKLLQWHAAFYAGIQIELAEEADNLLFENEHMLSTKPMQVDVLITKKDAKKSIRKNIGQIFRKYNLIEYKSPDDYLSINDFYKMLGYAYFYIADTAHVNEIQYEELSISYVCAKYPRELISHLVAKGHTMEKKEEGIYYVHGNRFAIQIVVNPTLSEEKNLWLKNLTNGIKDAASVEQLVRAYENNKENTLYSSILDILIRANRAKFSEVKEMCEALKELFKEELEEKYSQGISQGIAQSLEKLVRIKVLKKKSLEQIASELEAEVEELRPIYNQIKKALAVLAFEGSESL